METALKHRGYSSGVNTLYPLLKEAFAPDYYCFTELYNEARTLQPHDLETKPADAIYVLKYALHTTLSLMIKNKKNFLSIDEVVMDVIIEKMRPAFSQASLGSYDPGIGFAVSIDFSNQMAIE